MALFPSAPGGVQIEVLPRWPGKIVATGGIKAAATGGTVTIESDIPSLVEVTPADNEGRFVHVWNEATDTNERVELVNLPTQSQSWNELTDKPAAFPPDYHTHIPEDIEGSTSVGIAVFSAPSQAAARTAIGAAAANHSHTASQVTDFSEAVDDRVAALLQPGSGVNLSYNDTANTLTISTSATGPATALATYSTRNSTQGHIPTGAGTPQWTDGLLLMSVTITPSAATNRIRLFFNGLAGTGAETSLTAALFRGTTCIRAVSQWAFTNVPTLLTLLCEDTPNTTSPITYSIRIGTATIPMSLILNRWTASSDLGTAPAFTLIAHEVIP